MTSTRTRVATLAGAALLAAGCSTMGGSGGSAEGEVVLLTHDSFTLPKQVIRQWESETGYDLVVRASGDAGELATKLSLSAGNPQGDVAFGVDNTFASRPLGADAFVPHEVDLPEGAAQYTVSEGEDRLAPVDVGHVCVNIDKQWFAEHDLTPPRTFEDLTAPRYRGLFVTPAASTSSPGMAFLLATIAEYGDRWPAYWSELMANDTRVVAGWSDAYYTDFTGGGDDGDRPIVLSYDSSPAFTVPKGAAESTTAALLETCFRQVEYAGVLAGADNPAGARAVVELLLSDRVQAVLPTSMYVYPVANEVELPEEWARHAQQPEDPHQVPAARIAEHRDEWLTRWTDVTSR